MSFKLDKVISDYLDNDWRKPPANFVNCSEYYAGLDPYFINYMKNVVRPCMAYANGVADGTTNSGLRMNVGYSIIKNAVGLVIGDRVMFEGDDADCHVLSDHWQDSVNFDAFLESAIRYMFDGTCAIKLNMEANGRCVPVAIRSDRFYPSFDENGNVVSIVIMNSFLWSEKIGENMGRSYWLVEERYYKNGQPKVRYRVHFKSGIIGQEVLPTIDSAGIPMNALPENVANILRQRGVRLNKEQTLPFRDGLGVWLLRRTATNSSAPGLPLGDPLLYGALDLLWAVDVVYSGSLKDVLNGEGIIVAPKRFLGNLNGSLGVGVQGRTQLPIDKKDTVSERILRSVEDGSTDDSRLVFVTTEHDKDFIPQSVQFNIRSTEYNGMLEIYLRQIVTMTGFAPTSIFPFLQDGSLKTATEVTADENLTRNTVKSLHKIIEPVLNRLINEVLYQLYKACGMEYDGKVTIKLSDYIGNPIQRERLILDRLNAHAIPHKEAVKQINGLTDSEANEYTENIKADIEEQNKSNFGGGADFDPADYFGDQAEDGNGDMKAEG